MIDLFAEIQNRLVSQVPELQVVDLDNQQVERQNESYPFQFPCILVNYSVLEWKGDAIQQGDTIVSLRVYQQVTEDTHSSSDQKEAAFEELALINSVHAKLQNFKGTNFSKLQRRTTNREARADGYTCTILEYRTTYIDKTAEKVYQTMTATPEVQVEMKKTLNG